MGTTNRNKISGKNRMDGRTVRPKPHLSRKNHKNPLPVKNPKKNNNNSENSMYKKYMKKLKFKNSTFKNEFTMTNQEGLRHRRVVIQPVKKHNNNNNNCSHHPPENTLSPNHPRK